MGKNCENIRSSWYFKIMYIDGSPAKDAPITSIVSVHSPQWYCHEQCRPHAIYWQRHKVNISEGKQGEVYRMDTWKRRAEELRLRQNSTLIKSNQHMTSAVHSWRIDHPAAYNSLPLIYYYKIFTTQVSACDYMRTGKSQIILGQTWDHETCAFHCPFLKKAAICKSTTCPATVTVKWQCQKCGVQAMQQY
jgi:hypothetical protein